jgi:hypothetical protein
MLTQPALTGVCRFFEKNSSTHVFLLAAILFMVLQASPAQAANILVVTGTDSIAIQAGNVLNTELTMGGNTVTVANTGVPVSLAGFTQIYDTRYGNTPAFTSGEMSQYLAFLNAAAGNTIFMMGENQGFNSRNAPINQFIALAGGGTIAAPASSSTRSETVNSPFTGTGANAISTITYAACGLVTSPGTGAFASSESGGGCAIFFGPGTLANATGGSFVVVYDVNFIATAPTGGAAVNEVAFRKNLEAFVAAPSVGTPPTPSTTVTSISPNTGPAVGGTAVTITGTGFTGATAVTFGSAAAAFTINSATSITATSPVVLGGTVDITVTAGGTTSPTSAADQFTFVNYQLSRGTPTLGEWAMLGLTFLLGGAGYLSMRRAAAGRSIV